MVLDQETIAVLKDALADEFPLLVDTFLSDAPQRIAELHIALGAKNFPALEKPAHTLKGSSGNIGAMDLCRACSDLVEDIRQNRLDAPEERVAAIENALAQLVPALTALK